MTITGNNASTVRENNLALIIRLIHKAKICSRADLAVKTGLKQATITYIINDLIKCGLVKETGSIEGRLKRRSIGVTINDELYRVIGIRLNREYLTAGLFSVNGRLIEQYEIRFDRHPSPEAVMAQVKSSVHKLIDNPGNTVILGIGMAIPGPYMPSKRKIELMSGFPGWNSIDIKSELNEEFSLPVYLEHDANCGALAEFWYGDVGDAKNILYVAADVGVGAGILIDGQLYKGQLGIAGEIGHMSIKYDGPVCECGNKGCLEIYCSTKNLTERYNRSQNTKCTADEILRSAAAGDEAARKIFAESADYLGIGLAGLINVLNPDLIILSDKLSLAGDYLLETVSNKLKTLLLEAVYRNINIRLGTNFDGDAMLFGAGAVVLENLLLQPTAYFKEISSGS